MLGYQVKHDLVRVDGLADLHIRSLLDLQQFFDPDGVAARLGISSALWPLFGILWPSGRQLAAHMSDRPVKAGERILEIGCGLALASLVSHRRGADVTASDCHPLASTFLAENLRLNELPPMPYRHGDWSQGGAPAEQGPANLLARPLLGRFELIMGSDVLYERDDGGSLPRFIERHATPAAEVLIVDPNRGNRRPFNHRMADLGFILHEHVLSAALPDGSAYRGRLLQYLRADPLQKIPPPPHGPH